MKKSKEFLDGYLTGFLGKAMRMSMDEPTEQALADVLADFIDAMAVLYAKDKAPKLTVQDDIYDLHLDMARVYLPDIENAEVESYNHAD